MARTSLGTTLSVTIALAALGLGAGGFVASAQDAVSEPIHPGKKEQDPLVQLVKSLSAEQKSKLIESIKAWKELTPEVQQALRAREKMLRKSLAEEIEAALANTSPTQEQREFFAKRYREERRKIDQSLRTELEARRKVALEEVVAQLKATLEIR